MLWIVWLFRPTNWIKALENRHNSPAVWWWGLWRMLSNQTHRVVYAKSWKKSFENRVYFVERNHFSFEYWKCARWFHDMRLIIAAWLCCSSISSSICKGEWWCVWKAILAHCNQSILHISHHRSSDWEVNDTSSMRWWHFNSTLMLTPQIKWWMKWMKSGGISPPSSNHDWAER